MHVACYEKACYLYDACCDDACCLHSSYSSGVFHLHGTCCSGACYLHRAHKCTGLLTVVIFFLFFFMVCRFINELNVIELAIEMSYVMRY